MGFWFFWALAKRTEKRLTKENMMFDKMLFMKNRAIVLSI
jgi:hypothetical protein